MLKIYGISGDNREDYALALSDGTSLLESKLYAALSKGNAEDSDGTTGLLSYTKELSLNGRSPALFRDLLLDSVRVYVDSGKMPEFSVSFPIDRALFMSEGKDKGVIVFTAYSSRLSEVEFMELMESVLKGALEQ
jgi:hypothetical protein